MRFQRVFPLVALGLGLAFCPPALAAGTALDGTTILPDPSLAHDRVLPASVATAGVAAVSAATDGPLKNCSRLNPCAIPTPARDNVSMPAAEAAAPAVNPLAVVRSARVAKTRRAMAAGSDLRS